MLTLQGEITFEYNRAEIGSAIVTVATESEVYLNDQVYVVNNGRQNCTYQLRDYAEVIKGCYFNMSLVAIDQV
jgi:predicted outer membrane repeat protein